MQSRRNVIPEASVITDFAITSVDVPDRLDAQELRDRTDAEQSRAKPGQRRSARWRWALRTIVVLAAGLTAVAAFKSFSLAWSEITTDRIARRLSSELGQPVSVANTSVRLAPSPRLVIEGIRAGDRLPLGAATLRFDWGSLPRFVRGGDWAWGEVTIAPLELSAAEVWALIDAVPGLSAAIPDSIGSITLESLRLRDAALLTGRYRVVAERSARGGPFDRLVLEELGSHERLGLDMRLRWSGPSEFRLRASKWLPPIGPGYEWAEVSADGSFTAHRLHIENFSASGLLGVVTGSLDAVDSSGWAARGAVSASNIDLTAMQRELRRRNGIAVGTHGPPVLQGVMSADGVLTGTGVTLARAIDALVLTGKASVRFAALNGIDLGVAAVQPGGGQAPAASTRFGQLDTRFLVSRGTIRLQDISGVAGALRIHGSVGIDRNLILGGILRPEVTRPAGGAPVDLRVSGTVFDPIFEH
jgi:hypothetical protein